VAEAVGEWHKKLAEQKQAVIECDADPLPGRRGVSGMDCFRIDVSRIVPGNRAARPRSDSNKSGLTLCQPSSIMKTSNEIAVS